jgi:CHAT domain-containing protein
VIRASAALLAAVLVIGTGAASADDGGADPSARAAQSLRAGRLALERGRFEEAAAELASAAELFRALGPPRERLEALLQLSQAELALGALDRAEATLAAALPLAASAGSPAQRAATLASAGTLAVARDDPTEARRLLADAAARALEAGELALAATAELNLGALEAVHGDPDQAVTALERAAKRAGDAGDPALAARALANAARVLSDGGTVERAFEQAGQAQERASELPDGHAKAAVLVHLAATWRALETRAPTRRGAIRARSQLALALALEAARAAGDIRSESEALGYLGALYEAEGRNEEALALTRAALLVAGSLDAPESAYRWQWQSARLLAATGRTEEASGAYQAAIETLGRLDPGTLSSRRRGSSFAADIAPVYRGLVDLLLRRAALAEAADEAGALRERARDLMEHSKAAELRDYFRDDCVDAMRAKVKRVDEVSHSAVIVYPIVLDDRLEILLLPPGGALRQFTVQVSRETLEGELRALRRLLLRRTTREYAGPARRLYAWLVAPWQDVPTAVGADTLVFVPDGLLRTVPMAALHDGERFLVERFALAVTPGLELTDPRRLETASANVLIGGVSQSVDGFPALDHVPAELASVQETLGGKVLLDSAFRRGAIEAALAEDRARIVHVATHGEFEDDADQSFLVAWDGRVSGDDLASYIGFLRFREEPLELLTLSACETARGERAALGLLGIAVRSGARSALGSLWQVSDDSTTRLMGEFYRAVAHEGLTRAQALRHAQLALLREPGWSHPLHWSAFVLINGWL